MKQRLKQEDPQGYIELEDQMIQKQESALKNQKEQLENLKASITQANSEPEEEAKRLIEDKNLLIETIKNELQLARNRYEQGNQDTQNLINKYTQQLRQQENEIRELKQSFKQFKQKVINQSEFAKIISFKRINQYELGGLFIGELSIHNKIIRIYQGDITNLVTDVIVSSDDNYLTMGGGVSYKIRSKSTLHPDQ